MVFWPKSPNFNVCQIFPLCSMLIVMITSRKH